MPRHGRTVNVNLTVEARQGWQTWADDAGADVTALLEVVGLHLIARPKTLRLDQVGRQARLLSTARRRRA
jgi:hypothetical protein